MYKELVIENFKCFSKETRIPLGKISVCLGENSVGKSSVIQSCILIRQIYEEMSKYKGTRNRDYRVQLNDVYGLQLGNAENIKSSKNKKDIVLKLDTDEFRLESIDTSCMEMNVKTQCEAENLEKRQGIFAEYFYYLNAERLGPRNYHLIDSKVLNTCGVHGENTIHLLNAKGIHRVDAARCFELDENKKVNTVSKQVEYWMDYVVPGIELRTDDIMDLRISKVSVRQPVFDTDFLSPYNFGFGISYVLPIILTGLIAEEGSAFLVENPEAHLHPKAQSHIGYFLAIMAFAGLQVIVETHSEHVINGIRIAALEKQINPEDICMNFFSIRRGEQTEHKITPVKLNDRMDIENWPEGFMDQEENDLRTMRRIRRG